MPNMFGCTASAIPKLVSSHGLIAVLKGRVLLRNECADLFNCASLLPYRPQGNCGRVTQRISIDAAADGWEGNRLQALRSKVLKMTYSRPSGSLRKACTMPNVGLKAYMLICKLHAVPVCGLQQRCRSRRVLIDRADRVNDVLGGQMEAPAHKRKTNTRGFDKKAWHLQRRDTQAGRSGSMR